MRIIIIFFQFVIDVSVRVSIDSLSIFFLYIYHSFYFNRNRYREKFRDIGVRGLDLLPAGDNEIAHFGITDPIHVNRFKVHLAQMVAAQKNLAEDTR